MSKALSSLYPDPEAVISLEPRVLGEIILRDLLPAEKKINRGNFNNDALRGYPVNYHERISMTVMEAWSWLEREELIAEEAEGKGWYFVTRKGKAFNQAKATPQEVDNLRQDETSVGEKSTDSGAAPASQFDDAEIRHETIFTSGITDQPATHDALGFEPYVKAIADFLTHEHTQAPLTLSIEGEWGSGKSSFMSQLKDLLSKRGNLTVEFNAWRHDKADELWAAFALDFIRQISRKRSLLRRFWANINLRRRRYDWSAAGWFDMFRAIAASVILVLSGVALPIFVLIGGWKWASQSADVIVTAMGEKGDVWTGIIKWLLQAGGGAAIIVIAMTAWLKLRKFIGNPIAIDLKRHLRSPNYEERIAFVERFHRDLKEIVRCYIGKRKVFVFIDDLDRCDVPKAADLMQAINLMIANDPQLVFLIGMDREKIAAGLAVKYEKLLPYLVQHDRSLEADRANETRKMDSAAGLEFGYRFIEKFIQLPFKVPQPSVSEFNSFLDTLTVRVAESPRAGRAARLRALFARREAQKVSETASSIQNDERDADQSKPQTESASVRRQVLNFLVGDAETEPIRDIVIMAGPILGFNPRRIKQFVNSFRLKAHIANETGLFDQMEGPVPAQVLTLEQLGKFVALIQVYPTLLSDLIDDPELLTKLQRLSLGSELETGVSEAVNHWRGQKAIMDLISYGLETNSHKSARYNLLDLDIERLVKTSPYVPRQVVLQAESGQIGLKGTDSVGLVTSANDESGRVANPPAESARINVTEVLESVKAELEKNRHRLLIAALDAASDVQMAGDEMVVEFASDARHSRDTLAKPSNAMVLREAISKVIGRNVGLRLAVMTEERVLEIINGLDKFSARGVDLLQEALHGDILGLRRKFRDWETEVENYLLTHTSDVYVEYFLDDRDMLEYTETADSEYSRIDRSRPGFLNRIHTRVVRLNRIIDDLQPGRTIQERKFRPHVKL
jgi:hypothetical protein